MSVQPLCFVHASDLHLERPLAGVAELPDHLRERFMEAPYRAAAKIFDTALTQQADFVVLAGDVLNAAGTGPRGPLFLAEQCQRLAAAGIRLYWATGPVDGRTRWTKSFPLPSNVKVFDSPRTEEVLHERNGLHLARILGRSNDRGTTVRPEELRTDRSDVFSVAVVHGPTRASSINKRCVDYWALGGSHARRTLLRTPHAAVYPGTPQGRTPRERGAHGCVIVRVGANGAAELTWSPTDVARWSDEPIAVDETTSLADLRERLSSRLATIQSSGLGGDHLVRWAIRGTGALTASISRGPLSGELLTWLRKEGGQSQPAVWSVSLSAVQSPAPSPPGESNTLLGDFLRELERRLQATGSQGADGSLDLLTYLPVGLQQGPLAAVANLAEPRASRRVLEQASALGIDLLSGEGAPT